MSATKPQQSLRPKTATAAKVTTKTATKAGSKPQSKPAAGKAKLPAVRPPLTDEEVGPIPGLPTEAEIEQHVGALSPADKGRFTKIRELLARRFGSHAAARLWLTTPGRGFDGTPLDAIRDGMADLVLENLKDQSGPNPPYA